MAEELKACPFCGGEPNLTHSDYVHDDLRPMPVVECKSCSAWACKEDWNLRAQQPNQGCEAVAWRRRDVVMGCKRFMTQKCYDAQSPQMKGNYEPFYCAHCKADQAPAGSRVVPVELLERLIDPYRRVPRSIHLHNNDCQELRDLLEQNR